MKQLFSNWTFMRILRLILAIVILIQALYARDTTTAAIGLMLLAMAFMNVGCCGAGGCPTPIRKTKNNNAQKEVSYEEVV